MILAADIGGTNTRLALFAREELRVPVAFKVFPSRDFASVTDVVERFLASTDDCLEAATFGVAGPVRRGISIPVNLGWVVSASELAGLLNLEQVSVVNDLEATALGLTALGDGDVVTVNRGAVDEQGTIAVIAAGTGLGQAGLAKSSGRPVTIATEGGNAGFSPATADESRLLDYVRGETGEHVSVEAVCSGYGLVNIFRWCLHEAGREPPDWLIGAGEDADAAARVSCLGTSGKDSEAVRALETFISIYGSEAGNLALRLFATGGVYVAGGIAGKLLDMLRAHPFMEAFANKGRLTSLMHSLPVHVVTNELTALLGSARHAAEMGRVAPGAHGKVI